MKYRDKVHEFWWHQLPRILVAMSFLDMVLFVLSDLLLGTDLYRLRSLISVAAEKIALFFPYSLYFLLLPDLYAQGLQGYFYTVTAFCVITPLSCLTGYALQRVRRGTGSTIAVVLYVALCVVTFWLALLHAFKVPLSDVI